MWRARMSVSMLTTSPTTSSPSVVAARVSGMRETSSQSRPVVASGGVSSLDDIAALRGLVPLGLEGAIVGKALYAGAFTLGEALDVAGQ